MVWPTLGSRTAKEQNSNGVIYMTAVDVKNIVINTHFNS